MFPHGARRARPGGRLVDAERWERLSPLLDALLELDPPTRERSLASLREEDPQLAEELAGLLALEEEGDDFLSQPLIAPLPGARPDALIGPYKLERLLGEGRSEEHTSELQSLMRNSYAVFCWQKKKKINKDTSEN